MKILASNRKASFEYIFIETFEAGIVLKGSEIKAIREKSASISEAWVKIRNGEAYVIGMTIPFFSQAKEEWNAHEPLRDRKLLLHKKEIKRLEKEDGEGVTIIPLDIHLNERNIAKLTIALAKGKKNYDKRETLKERDFRRLPD